MRIGSLFSGIGGLELGLERAGLGSVVWQVEQDDFCRAVLAKHWPDVDRSVTDVRLASSANLVPVDVICGGFPCQDVSGAGKGAGLGGSRSGLWYEYLRIVSELRPRVVIVENVESGARRWLCEVRSALHELGYRTRAMGVSAADVGAPHLRKRIFVVAHTDARGSKGSDAREECTGWHAAQPSREPLAHADGIRRVEPERRQQELRGRAQDSGPLADTIGGGRDIWTRPCANGARGGEPANGSRLGDAAGPGREGAEHESGEALRGVPPRPGRWLGQAECGMGRDAHGLPVGLDGHRTSADSSMRTADEMRWPSGRGEAQHEWEPPRTVTDRPPNRRARVKALGNAVVPQCAYIVGLAVRQMLEEAEVCS